MGYFGIGIEHNETGMTIMKKNSVFRPTKDALEAARNTVDHSVKGQPDEYRRILAQEIKDHKHLLERAENG